MGKKSVDEEYADLDELIRTAHEAMKDLNAVLKKVDAARDSLAREFAQRFTDRAEQIIGVGLEEYGVIMLNAIDRAERAIEERFDKVAGILLGTDPEAIAAGMPSIEEVARLVARSRAGQASA